MPFGVTWLVEDKLLLLQAWGLFGLNEMNQMDAKIGAMLDRSSSPLVHGIHDHRQTSQIPSAKDLMKIKSGSHPRVGWLVFVGLDNKLLKFFVSTTGQVLKLRVRFMDTIEEALAFLQDMDSTLPDLKAIDLDTAQARVRADAERTLT